MQRINDNYVDRNMQNKNDTKCFFKNTTCLNKNNMLFSDSHVTNFWEMLSRLSQLRNKESNSRSQKEK